MLPTCDIEIIKRRFWKKVDKGISCWEWKSCLNNTGYGRFRNPLLATRQKRVFAHRFSWEIANGAVPEGMLVLHKCDNPKCVRPDHLFLGTYKENAADCVKKGRHQATVNPGCYLRGEEMSRILRGRIVPPRFRGHKLTRDQANEIKRSSESVAILHRRYNVSESCIYKIRAGTAWA